MNSTTTKKVCAHDLVRDFGHRVVSVDRGLVDALAVVARRVGGGFG